MRTLPLSAAILLLVTGCPADGARAPGTPGSGPLGGEPVATSAGAKQGEPPPPGAPRTLCVLGEAPEASAKGLALARAQVESRAEGRLDWLESKAATEADLQSAWDTCMKAGSALVAGPFDPALTAALLPIAQSGQHPPLVIPELGAGTTLAEDDGVVVVGPGPMEMGRLAGKEAAAGGAKTAMVLHVPGQFGAGLADEFASAFQANGGEAEVVEVAENGDWAAVAKPRDAWFVAGPPEAAVAVAAKLSGTGTLWVIDWGMQADVIEAAPAKARVRLRAVAPKRPGGLFEKLYVEANGEVPGPADGLVYDTLWLAADGLLRAATGEPEDVLGALKISEYQSAFGESKVVAGSTGQRTTAPGCSVFVVGDDGWEPRTQAP